jgi:hypothetical protein
MPSVRFAVEQAQAIPFAVAPTLAFTISLDAQGSAIHAIALRCQIQIDPARRRYAPAEQSRLHDLFDAPSRWGQTLRSMLWTHAGLMVPPFDGQTRIELPVPCTFDFNVAVTKYFDALEDGDIPLTFLFSGTIFYPGEDGLQIAQIPWDSEATFRLPVAVWKQMMGLYYPNTAWLCLRKDVFDRLHEYKRKHACPTWEQVIERLLAEALP